MLPPQIESTVKQMESASVSRKEKRKALKKDKRKQIRKELAEKARAEEEARLNDPQLQRQIQLEEERQNERLERERKEFEERERLFLQELHNKEQQQERMNALEPESMLGTEEGSNEDDEWEYVEEGPPEIIWQGNEIIVKKNKVKVKKKDINQEDDPNRPTSNPLPPQHEAYASFKNAPMTSAELLETVAQQVPNFGTEQGNTNLHRRRSQTEHHHEVIIDIEQKENQKQSVIYFNRGYGGSGGIPIVEL